ncbi:MAG TPA: HisA/HisF-related TIM barrel protein, partial [Thermoanaerobaculia bacterium]|nr:HisA/HisF-related TIM barrel protein [Thermoanaerobaculia bacterium]
MQNGFLVRSEKFKIHQIIGNPIHEVARFSEWAVDELVYIDITKDDQYDQRRDDSAVKTMTLPLQILEEVSKSCFMPLTFGGRIRTIQDIRDRTVRGADKVTINTIALEDPDFITQAAKVFGSQAIVVSMDVLRHSGGEHEVFAHWGADAT